MPVIRARRRSLGGQWTGSSGNAQLDPLESDNLDLSFEYYYGEGSAFTVAYFDKSISNFIGNEQVTRPLFGLTDVASGLAGYGLGRCRRGIGGSHASRW